MIKNKKKIVFLLLLVLIFVTGCSSARISEKERAKRTGEITRFYRVWKGTPYRLGGTTKKGVDCSALVQNLYRDRFEKKLPRTTKKMAEEGEKVKDRSEWEVGDLVFFRIGWKKTRHVGVYLGNNRFLHASTSRGVIISTMDSYWVGHFWQVRKILE
ncbi:NlpC/P60 family protein [uncultured Cetobacterium sp.]|uniref:C40 family peptidase n=1 Tax=uncultured Cetobacterium sp. TaxID=527638 RepID=UPI00263065E7|nr:NlpC/P60 family protein [uncultured Cetobacterium sp.]